MTSPPLSEGRRTLVRVDPIVHADGRGRTDLVTDVEGAGMRTARRAVSTHLVDSVGLVGCPEQHHDVAFEACLSCRHLTGVEQGEHGRVMEIHCTGGRRESPLTGPWGWIGPLGS